MFVPTAIVAILAIPLALKLVPPNRIYGYRSAHALADREHWYRINQVAGLALLAASAVAAMVYATSPDLASGRSLVGVLVLVVPVAAALVATGWFARKIVARSSAQDNVARTRR
jgi:hypothetical protein